jgi:hypothetical protein
MMYCLTFYNLPGSRRQLNYTMPIAVWGEWDKFSRYFFCAGALGSSAKKEVSWLQ